MGQEEINQAQEQLARLFGNYMEQVFEDNKNKNLKFIDFIEKPMCLAAMRRCNGNKTKAAKYLGISSGVLNKKLEKYFGTTKFDKRTRVS